MAIYGYKALNLKGRSQQGTLDAPSLEEAKQRLRAQGVMVTSLWPRRRRARREQLRGQRLIDFTSQLAQLVSSGMPVFESLTALEEQFQGERHHRILVSLCEQIKAGASLSDALRQYPESFNALYCAMVSAGEASGTLGLVLLRLSELLKKQLKLKKQVIGALTYPAIICGFCVVVIYLLLTFAIPSIAALLGDRQLNAYTAVVLHVSHFLTSYWPLYLPLIFVKVAASVAVFRSQWGRNLWKRWLLRLPVLRELVIKSALARFCRTLATLQEGGLTAIDSLRLARSVMLNPTLEAEMQQVEERIVEGGCLSQELKAAPHIPKLMGRMVAVGEESGNLTPMLQQVAELYEQELERSLTRFTALLQPAVLLIMGGVVGLIMLAVLLPLTDMSSLF